MSGLSKDNVKESTRKMMVGLTPGMRASTQNPGKVAKKIADLITRFDQLNLNNPRLSELIVANPDCGNRLLTLFRTCNELNIPLTGEAASIIAANISHVGGAINLLGKLKQVDIEPNSVPLDLLFHAAKSDSVVAQSATEMYDRGERNRSSFNLIFTYPEQSFKISKLISSLRESLYDTGPLVDKLLASSISEKHLDTMIDLLNLLVEKDAYDFNMVDVFLRQCEHLDKIYRGAEKLVEEPYLLGKYFESIEQNSEKANIFAKNLLLLHSVSLLNNNSSKKDYLMVNKLGIGAFHFMKQLQQAGMLNEESYQKICQNNGILDREEVIEALTDLPIVVNFQNEELEKMLDLVGKPEISNIDIHEFKEIVEIHHLSNKPTPSFGA